MDGIFVRCAAGIWDTIGAYLSSGGDQFFWQSPNVIGLQVPLIFDRR